MKGPFLTVPNILSLSRVPLSAAASAFLLEGSTLLMICSASAAILTDWLDGALARRSGAVSEWGKLLDPAADKIGFAFFGISLALLGRIPVWFIVLLASRDLLIAGGGLLLAGAKDRVPPSNIWGKAATVILSVYMIRQAVHPAGSSVLLGLDALGLAALAGLAASTFSYALRARSA